MSDDRVVISLGGSVLVPGKDDAVYIRTLADLLLRLADGRQLFLVTGGGRPARTYIEVGRALGLDERALDALGILVTRVNARLLIHALGPRAYPEPPEDYEEARAAGASHDLVVMGGQRVGITTDAVAAELAEAVGARRLVNATNVDGVYTADPRTDPDAARVERMGYEELLRIAGEPTGRAGPSIVIDPLAARVIQRAGLEVIVVNGRDLASLEGAVAGGAFVGTRIGEGPA